MQYLSSTYKSVINDAAVEIILATRTRTVVITLLQTQQKFITRDSLNGRKYNNGLTKKLSTRRREVEKANI